MSAPKPRAQKPRVPKWRWGVWLAVLAAADVVFYVLLTPLWLGLRGAAWIAEWRSRRTRAAAQPADAARSAGPSD